MLQINELEVGKMFYSTNKFTLTFRDGSYQYGGVIRFGHSIIYKYKSIGNRKFKSVSTMPFSHDYDEEKIVESSYFDRDSMVSLTEADLIRDWYINASDTIESFKNYHDGGRNLTEWVLESKKVKAAMEQNPEKWL